MTQPTCDTSCYDSADLSAVADVNAEANAALNTSVVDLCLGVDLDVCVGIGIDIGNGCDSHC